MASHRPAKKAKLAKLLSFQSNLPFHSQSVLEAIVEKAKSEGLPELYSSTHQREARLDLLQDCHGGLLGPLIQEAKLETKDGNSCTMYYANFLVYLANLYHMDSSFTKLIQRRHAQRPSSPSAPWGLVLCTDEIVPGNVLGRAARKCWTIYATFDAFQTDMSSEAAWLTLCTQRSTFVSTLDGGISQMMNIILQSIFDSPLVDTSCGFQLKSPSGDLRIHFTWSMMLCDGAAHKMVWTSKGDAGQKFCLLCANIRGMPASKEEEEPDEMYSSAMQYKDLVLVQDADVLASYQRLDARQKTCSKQEFQDWEKASGLSWSKHSILLNTRLIQKNLCKPVSQFVHDYMHGILQGTAPIVLWQTMNAIQACGLQVWPCLEQYLNFFQFPKAWRCQHLPSLFQATRVAKYNKNHKFSCMASECLSVFPAIRHFLHSIVVPKEICQDACQAFVAMAETIDQIHAGVCWGATSRASLLHIIEESLATFHKAFPSVGMIRKWHWMLHLPDSLQRYGQLPNCFACERKHKAISALATKLKRTMTYERHMMEQVLATEITMLREPDQFPEGTQIIQPKQANSKQIAALSQFISPPCPEAKVSSVARLERGGYCHAQDAIVYADGGGWKVAQVLFHVVLHGMHCTFVQPWCLQKCHLEKQHAKFRPSDLQGLILLQSILYPVVFCKDKDEATVLLPYQIYSQG